MRNSHFQLALLHKSPAFSSPMLPAAAKAFASTMLLGTRYDTKTKTARTH
jgi:hypothetical protein